MTKQLEPAPADRKSAQIAARTRRWDGGPVKIAIALERIALQDEYFIEKTLYPKIDSIPAPC